METVPPHLQATCSGLLLGAGELFGGALIPVAAGSIADALDFNSIMLVATVLFAVATALSFMLTETNQKKLAQPASVASE